MFSFCLSVCLSVSLSLCFYVSVCLSVSLCFSVSVSFCLSVCLSVCLCLSLSPIPTIKLPIFPSFSLFEKTTKTQSLFFPHTILRTTCCLLPLLLSQSLTSTFTLSFIVLSCSFFTLYLSQCYRQSTSIFHNLLRELFFHIYE